MATIYGIVQTMFWCGTILGVTLAVSLSLPQSKLRDFLMPIVFWGIAIFCAIYAINPVDFLPEALFGPVGLVDDLAAAAAGYMAARKAMTKPSKN